MNVVIVSVRVRCEQCEVVRVEAAQEHDGGRKGLKPVNKGASKNFAISDVDITEGQTLSPLALLYEYT